MNEYCNGLGRFADVYRGKCVLVPSGVRTPPPVAIKVIRPVSNVENPNLRKAMVVSNLNKADACTIS
jgi:hypothetical protein